MLIKSKPRIVIVGATGAVGQELIKLIEERGLDFSEVHLVASERSKGRTLWVNGTPFEVQALEEFNFSKIDIAFFSAGTALSKIWAKKAAGQGALVIDNTNAFRMDPSTPLVVPQVNGHLLEARPKSGIIANPNCSTIQMVRVLKPIHDLFGLSRVVVSTYQAASGAGSSGIMELEQGAILALGNSTPVQKRFPRPLAFNVVPQVDVLLANGFTLEEEKMLRETCKIMDLPSLDVTATAVRVPVRNGHSEAVYLETVEPLNKARVVEALTDAEDIRVHDGETYPTPRFLTEKNWVHVGRIRQHPLRPNAMWCWIVADNLRIGAALNAIQIAERVIQS